MFTTHSGAAALVRDEGSSAPQSVAHDGAWRSYRPRKDGTARIVDCPPFTAVKHHLRHSRQASSETEHLSTCDFLAFSALVGQLFST
jgi:hypothetical protein